MRDRPAMGEVGESVQGVAVAVILLGLLLGVLFGSGLLSGVVLNLITVGILFSFVPLAVLNLGRGGFDRQLRRGSSEDDLD